MNKAFAALLIGATVLSGAPAMAQDRGHDRDRNRESSRQWDGHRDQNRNSDRNWNRNDNRNRGDNNWQNRARPTVRYYGGNYGYNGYSGRWRTGQRYPYYNNNRYVVYDYGRYGLPAPRYGYQYYRDDNGDVVMAAIASGIIGLIIGDALSDHNDGYNNGYSNGYYPPQQPYYPSAPYYPRGPYGY